jgi:hypothetical protein
VRRTRQIFRKAEFGFFGVIVRTCRQTPRFWGDPRPRTMRCFNEFKLKRSAGAEVFFLIFARPFRTSWLIVGNATPRPGVSGAKHQLYVGVVHVVN